MQQFRLNVTPQCMTGGGGDIIIDCQPGGPQQGLCTNLEGSKVASDS